MKRVIAVMLFCAATFTSQAQTLDSKLSGNWLTEDKTVVSFYQCQSGWCAKQVSAVKEKEKKNIGKVIAKAVTASSDTELKGTVIDPDNNKEYSAKWTMSEDGKTLTIKVKWGLLSFKEKWIKQ